MAIKLNFYKGTLGKICSSTANHMRFDLIVKKITESSFGIFAFRNGHPLFGSKYDGKGETQTIGHTISFKKTSLILIIFILSLSKIFISETHACSFGIF